MEDFQVAIGVILKRKALTLIECQFFNSGSVLAWIPTGPSILNKQAFGFNAGSLSRNPNVI